MPPRIGPDAGPPATALDAGTSSASATAEAATALGARTGRTVQREGRSAGRFDRQPAPHPPAARAQLVLELLELALAPPHQLELPVDVGDRALEDLPPAARVVALLELAPQHGARLLPLGQLAQLVERHPEQVLEPQE